MINRNEITIVSRLGRIINNMFLTHSEGSRNLVVLFPGGDNSTDIPTLHYARKATLLIGCDVLSLEYGTLSKPEVMNLIIDDCYDSIIKCLEKNYDKIFFISKSIGNFISFRIDERLANKNIEYISYTPISLNIEDIVKRNCIVFSGTKDKWLTDDDRDRLLIYENIKLIQIENAAHSLEIDDDYGQSIEILKKVTDNCVEYIKERMSVS